MEVLHEFGLEARAHKVSSESHLSVPYKCYDVGVPCGV